MHLRPTLAFPVVRPDFPSQCTWSDRRREGAPPRQRVRGLYSGSFLSFSFSVSASSLAITKECE